MKREKTTTKEAITCPVALRHLLAYDSYVANRLSVWQRMAVHQLIAGHGKGSKTLMKLLLALHETAAKWEAPEVRYNGNKELEIMDPKTGNFSLINNE